MSNRLAAPDAEVAVLGAIVGDPSILGWLSLDDEHFSLTLHQHVFRAMRRLYEDDRPIDEITVLDACMAENPSILGTDVSRIAVKSSTSDNAEHWAGILEEHRRLRVIALAVEKATKVLDGRDVGDSGSIQDGLLTELENLVVGKTDRASTMEDVTDAELDRMERQWDGGENPRYPTNIREVDLASGGIPIGVLTGLGARTGTGKSTLMWNIMYQAACRGDHVLVMSNEDRPQVMARLGIAHETGIERRKLLQNVDSTIDQSCIRQSVESLREINARIHTLRIHGLKMREICRLATGLVRRYNIKLASLDYIQNVPSEDHSMKRTYGIEDALTTLEVMTANEELALIVVGQLKRINEDRRPVKEDMKDSGAIEAKCKLILLMSTGEEGTIDLDIAKNSEGRENEVLHLHIDLGVGRVA